MNTPKKILISGASGLIGTRLTELLVDRKDSVAHLIRSKRKTDIPSFQWDIPQQYVDPKALQGTDTIINLSGAGVADKRWNAARKQEIIESRVKPIRLLYETLKQQNHQVRNFISASGISYYGTQQEKFFREADPPASDFLACTSQVWEEEADKIASLGIRVVKLRIGIVLSERGGALPKLITPVRFLVGAPLGSGIQYMSWIHIDDLCSIFMKAIDDSSLIGPYNAVSPHPATNREMTHAIGKTLQKPVILPAVPGFILKIVLGEMADMVLTGNKVSADKIQEAGFRFRFPNLNEALADLLKR